METEARVATARRRRFTAEEYHKMTEAGILHEDDRVELIEGDIVEMAAIGSRHMMCVIRLTRLLVTIVDDGALVSPQNPVRLGERLEPEPDLAVLRVRDYTNSLPGSEDVLLLMEVSDTTLEYDRGVKLPLYARSGISEVWILDLAGDTVERHTGPSADGYRHTERARRGETLASEAFPSLILQVDAILG